MSRPVKNYCDYFTHDRDMRNHRKIKAIRTKFGVAGYGIWVMVLEYLTGGDSNVFEHSEMEMELMAGDFGVSVTEITDVINFCIKLELLFVKDGFVHSESLDDRLSTVYEKRKVSKSISKKQQRVNGKFISNKTVEHGVSVETKPQSKVKESKVKEIIQIGETEIKYLVPEMFEKFQEAIPTYPGFIENDFEPLRKISDFLLKHLKLNGNIVKNKDAIVEEWSKISNFISLDNFYQTKTLSVISNQIQEIFQIHKHGRKPKGTGTNLNGTPSVGKTLEMDKP